MEKIYISISITYYSTKSLAPSVHFYKNDGVNPAINSWNLTPEAANWLMWELMKQGGKNEYQSNIFDNAISTRMVTYWGPSF